MSDAVSSTMLELLKAVARKNCEDRRRRQIRGQARAWANGPDKGWKENTAPNDVIASMLRAGAPWSQVQAVASLPYNAGKGDEAALADRLRRCPGNSA
jgi:hypothetical protein